MSVLLPGITVILLVFALIDILTKTDDQIRGLPKIAWVILVILVPVVGSIVWFAAGREYGRRVEQIGPRDQSRYHEAAARTLDHRVRSTEQQLADLDREAEHYERLARLAKLEAEVEQRRSTAGDDVPA